MNLNPIQGVLLKYFLNEGEGKMTRYHFRCRDCLYFLDIFETKTNVGGGMGLEVYYFS